MLGVQTLDKNRTQGKESVDRVISKLLDVFKELQIPDPDNRAAQLSVNPSTPAEKFVYTSSRQRFACIGPLKRLGHSSIEVLDEVNQRLMQLLDGVETGAFEQAPHQDAKPNLDLIEPGGMLRGIDQAEPVARIG